MNVNLTTATDSPKASKVIGEVGEISAESTEVGEAEEGFFSKLAAFILGESKSNKVSPESEVDASDQIAATTGEDSVDALLKSELLSDEGVSDVEVDDVNTETLSDSLLSKVQSDDASEEPLASLSKGTEFYSSQVMNDGDEILAKLNDATESLKTKNGNNLPMEDIQPHATMQDKNQGTSAQLVVQAEEDSSPKPPLTTQIADAETVEQNSQSLSNQGAKATDVASGIDQATAQKSDTVPEHIAWRSMQESSTDAQTKDNLHVIKAVTELDEQSGKNKPSTQASDIAVSENMVSNFAPQATLQAGVTSLTDELVDEHALIAAKQQQVLNSAKAEQASRLSKDMLNMSQPIVTQSEMKPEAAKQVSPEMFAPVQGQPTTLKSDFLPDAMLNNVQHHSKAQQVHLAQSVQQALNAQPMAHMNLDKAITPAIPHNAEINPTQLQHLAALAATPAAVNVAHQQMGSQAALRTALSAKSGDNLLDGQMVRDGKDSSGLANQIAGASGQQGGGGVNSLRADSSQAVNSPLQLTRDNVSDQMAEKVHMMMSKNLKNIDIRLDPPELGRLQIRLHMNGEGAGVHFTVANHQARDAIEQSLPRLREMLSQQGVQLGDTSVQQQSAGQQQRYTASSEGGFSQGIEGNGGAEDENLEAGVNLDLNVTSKRDGISYYA
ncbi:flagellar hook-length control protein FliK [Vibrio sp. S4M6]|uniref:flagellar hook-length control protein FliK n=1 Tax=Vibrio sinus TaxID=2946865 RepID=UPI002029FFB3|nr:flagellar hook-length control protein FliK [Vibrio sinus]MCL9781887.1 flagellar hook-length control protein FliK [Vibrio sinus]